MKKAAIARYASMAPSDLNFLKNLLSVGENMRILKYVFDNHDAINELHLPSIAKEFGIPNYEMAETMKPLVKHGILCEKVNTKSDLGNCEKYIYSPTALGKWIMEG